MSESDVYIGMENDLGTDEFIDVLRRSTLGERRPIDDRARIENMLAHADLIVTARDAAKGDLLVGVSRCLTDFAFCCYCSDLAVDAAYQNQGLGGRLIDASREAAGLKAKFFLLSAPGAMDYYPKIGMARLDNAFGFPTPPEDQ